MRLLKRNPNTRSWEQKLRKKRGRRDRGLHEEWVMGDGGGRVMDGEERQGRVLCNKTGAVPTWAPGVGSGKEIGTYPRLDLDQSTSTLDAEHLSQRR